MGREKNHRIQRRLALKVSNVILNHRYGHRGGQKTVELDLPDQFGRPVRSLARIYTDGYGYGYLKYLDNGQITVFGILVGWIPARPTIFN